MLCLASVFKMNQKNGPSWHQSKKDLKKAILFLKSLEISHKPSTRNSLQQSMPKNNNMKCSKTNMSPTSLKEIHLNMLSVALPENREDTC